MISLELLIASGIGVLMGGGIYLTLRGRTFPVVLGLMLMSYAVNLFLFGMGRLRVGAPPIIEAGKAVTEYTDPVPQALVLTAIVIGFGMTAFAITLAVKGYTLLGTDHIDGEESA